MSTKANEADGMGVVKSSGNVFADLGLPNAEEELAKAELAFTIRNRIREKALSQAVAAKLLKTDQAKISLIMNGKVGGFTFDRLMRFLNALEMDVKISVKQNPANKRGKTLVLR